MVPQTAIDEAIACLNCDYAFYYKPRGGEAILRQNNSVFLSASIIKVPLLFSWIAMEYLGQVRRHDLCELRKEPPVEGSGLARFMRQETLPYSDVLLFMMALSDNLCTNLVINRLTLPRIKIVFRYKLGLSDTTLERKLMDYEARARGLDNRISARDCIRFFELRDRLRTEDRRWFGDMLAANTDGGLFLRNIPRDTVTFHHKTGNIEGVLHDWGYTDRADIFLLTQNVRDEREVYRALDILGPALLGN